MATADWWRILIAGIYKACPHPKLGLRLMQVRLMSTTTIQDPNLNMHSETGALASIPAAYLLCRRHHSKDQADVVQRIR
jgi:hypothetical protein